MPSEREGWAVEVTVTVREEFGERREVVSWRDQTPPLAFQAASDIHGTLVRAVQLVFRLFRFGDALFSTARNAQRGPSPHRFQADPLAYPPVCKLCGRSDVDPVHSVFNPKNPQGLG